MADAQISGAERSAAGATPQVAADEILQTIRAELGQIAPDVSVENLDVGADIASLGIESVTMLELIAALEERYEIELPDDELTTIDTVGDVIALLQRHLSARTA